MIRWVRRWWYWGLDYAYVVWWQVVGLVSRRPPVTYASGDKAPVVLLPGVYETWVLLRPIADALGAAGHPIHVVRALGYNRRSISESAAIVMTYVLEHDLRGVALVGHSKGGLIGKHCLVVDDVTARIDRLVAVATPFAGSILARYVPSRTVRALGPHAETIGLLAASRELNARIVSIYGDYDPHIPGGSSLAGARNVEIPMVGHFRPLGDHRVIDAVVDAVTGRA
jgi:triacylglycerol lipase